MCCDPAGASVKDLNEFQMVRDCPICGGETVYDSEFDEYSSTNVCGYSPNDCDFCGAAPCDLSC